VSLVARIARGPQAEVMPLPFGEWVEYFTYGNQIYGAPLNQTLVGNKQRVTPNFLGLSQTAYKQNGIVFALIMTRTMLFSEARFQYRSRENGRPGDLFDGPGLEPLVHPWNGATTADLLALAECDASVAGNFFCARRGDGLRRLRPDWTTIVLGSNTDPGVEGYDIDAEPIGYIYQPGGQASGEEPEFLLPEEVAHYMPLPDPVAPWRGMSWLQPVITEILADKAAQAHKLRFFEAGATPNLLVSLPEADPEKFERWRQIFADQHEGTRNAYKSLFLGAGADAKVIGTDLKSLDFRAVQAYGETRLAAAAGVPPTILGLVESLSGRGLDQPTYESAIRRFGGLTIRPLWRNFSGSMARIIEVPENAELWYDDRDIPALQADEQDAVTATQTRTESIASLLMAGFEPDAVIAAVAADDITLLEGSHTGLPSVQLHPKPAPNGNGDAQHAAAVAALDHLIGDES
jgi:hypothetical protein